MYKAQGTTTTAATATATATPAIVWAPVALHRKLEKEEQQRRQTWKEGKTQNDKERNKQAHKGYTI